MRNTFSIDIDRPRQEVFDYLADDANLPELVPNLVEHRILEEKPGKVGTTFSHVYEEKGRRMTMTGVVTEHHPPERMAVALDGPMFALDVAYQLEDLGPGATRLTQISEARFKHVFKLMGMLFAKKMEEEGKRVQAENFARLKARLEG